MTACARMLFGFLTIGFTERSKKNQRHHPRNVRGDSQSWHIASGTVPFLHTLNQMNFIAPSCSTVRTCSQSVGTPRATRWLGCFSNNSKTYKKAGIYNALHSPTDANWQAFPITHLHLFFATCCTACVDTASPSRISALTYLRLKRRSYRIQDTYARCGHTIRLVWCSTSLCLQQRSYDCFLATA